MDLTCQRWDTTVYEYLINRANFAREEIHDLSPDEQKYLLTIYFYSLFFESIQEEKLILCFVGVKASGKSFIATSIGRILFGDRFFSSHLPDSPRDFKVTLSENYYTVFDNLDNSINDFLDIMCAAATGAEINQRKLYTDREEIKIRPHIFIAITSREPKFKRDDMVDRLLLFNTEAISNKQSRTALFGELRENREKIFAEILINLQSIIKQLKQKANWNPPGIFRIADWELFGKKVHSEKGINRFVRLLEKMNKEKTRFSLEDDEAYLILKYICYEREEHIENLASADLFAKFSDTAAALALKSFKYRYKNSKSLCRRLNNIKAELSGEFDIHIITGRANQTNYSFSKKDSSKAETKPI